jgi:hypothetical protein
MAKYIIKESEIRNYVRSLIREGRKAIDFQPEIKNGTFNLDKTILQDGSRRWLADFFKSKGVKKPVKPTGLNTPDRIIDINTGELVNKDEIDQFIANKRAVAAELHRNNMRRAKQGKTLAKTDDSLFTKSFVNNIKQDGSEKSSYDERDAIDDYTKKWLNMSDEERAAARDHIMNSRKQRQLRDNEARRQRDNTPQTSRYTSLGTEKTLKANIAKLEQKLKELGHRTDINARYWDDYTKVLNNNKRILNMYYGKNGIMTKQKEDDENNEDPYAEENKEYNKKFKKDALNAMYDELFDDDDDFQF